MEGPQTALTMSAPGELAPACLVPLRRDVACAARQERVFGPAVGHDRPLLAWEQSADEPTRYGP